MICQFTVNSSFKAIFTPDGNGTNDYFVPKGLGLANTVFNFYIFDRWGNMIYKSTEYGENFVGWDGKVQTKSGRNTKTNNGHVQEDVYIWVIETTDHNGDPHKYIGHVTVAILADSK